MILRWAVGTRTSALVRHGRVSSVSLMIIIHSLTWSSSFPCMVSTIAPHLMPSNRFLKWFWSVLLSLGSSYGHDERVLILLIMILVLVVHSSPFKLIAILPLLILFTGSIIFINIITPIFNTVKLASASILVHSRERPWITCWCPMPLFSLLRIIWIFLWALLSIFIIYLHLWLWLRLRLVYFIMVEIWAIVMVVIFFEVCMWRGNWSVLILVIIRL